MSTDYDAVCFTCRRSAHLFVRFTSGPAFAHGSGDERGRLQILDWLMWHLNKDHDVRIMCEPPDDFAHDRVEDRPVPK